MTGINRIFLVLLGQLAPRVVNLLPKTHSFFLRIHFLAITGPPVRPAARDVAPVAPSTARQFLPLPKTAFVPAAFRKIFGRTHLIYPPSFPNISIAARAITVPGPYTPATPASNRNW